MKGLVFSATLSIGLFTSILVSAQQKLQAPADRFKMEEVKKGAPVNSNGQTKRLAPKSNEMEKVREGVSLTPINQAKPVLPVSGNRFEMEKKRTDLGK